MRTNSDKRQIEYVQVSTLTPYARNSRTHTPQQVKQIAASIREFGFTNPVLVDEANGIIAGHGRVMAAEHLQLDVVPCIRLDYLTEAQKRAYVIADNKLALNAGWDDELLKVELDDLHRRDYDLSLLGFDAAELESIMQIKLDDDVQEDEVPELPAEPITKRGNIWQLGAHRLMCGDSTDTVQVAQLVGNEKADLILTDPPFGNNLGYGRGQLGERYILNDENTEILNKIYEPIDSILKPDTHCLIWIQWRTFSKLEKAFANYKLRTVVIWDKKQAGLSGGGFAEQYEMLCVFIKGKAKQSEYCGNVWSISRVHDRREKSEHPHKKPIEVLSKAILLTTQENALIVDLFGGSGSTMIAAHKTNRKAFLMELDPAYCDVIVQRWEALTGKKAELING